MSTNYMSWPYGLYFADDAVYVFDRRYRPLVRVAKPDAAVTTCDPDEWIEHDSKLWFYNDGCTPRRDPNIRKTLKYLIDSVPAIAAEVKRRNAAERKAVRA